MVLKGFSSTHEIVTATHAGKRPVEDVIGALLADPRVAYLHTRNDAYGCYMFRVERTAASNPAPC